jgi:hypothetical protein
MANRIDGLQVGVDVWLQGKMVESNVIACWRGPHTCAIALSVKAKVRGIKGHRIE